MPAVVFGSTSLGNLFRAITDDEKQAIIRGWFANMPTPVAIDTAGKYGAGLALEVLGRHLAALAIPPQNVVISNKLGWRRTPLVTSEPTFEPGAWEGLEHDAVQDISYDGIRRCWDEGNSLLKPYRPDMISVHDPDEYLMAARGKHEYSRRLEDIVSAYRGLCELRDAGQATAVGVGAKDWRCIQLLSRHCDFDWVMIANSFTVMNHPTDLTEFMLQLANRGVGIINSALFHGGFLLGGNFFDYRKLDLNHSADRQRCDWRDRFWAICHQFQIAPFEVACAFGRSHPSIAAVALSSSRANRIASHVASSQASIDPEVWAALRSHGLIDPNYPFLP